MQRNYKHEIEKAACDIIHWNYRNLEAIPEELLIYGRNIVDLYLKGNLISWLPCWFGELEFLTELHLFDNRIEEFPIQITCIRNLQVLDVGKNKISSIPEEIALLNSLTSFFAEENMIESIPRSIGKMKSLALLYLSRNKILEIPETIGDCNSLQEIVMDDNKLWKLPRTMMFLPNLTCISFRKNPFVYLPSIVDTISPSSKIIISKSPQLCCILDELLIRSAHYMHGENVDWNCEKFNNWSDIPETCTLVQSASSSVAIIPFPQVYSKIMLMVPSLFELCLRNFATLIGLNPQNIGERLNYFLKYLLIPKGIETSLRYPAAVCRNCRRFIFECTWLRLIIVDPPCSDLALNRTQIMQLFCSFRCINEWNPTNNSFQSYLVSGVQVYEAEWKAIDR